MPVRDEERERLAIVGYYAMMGTLRQSRNRPDAMIAPWATVDRESQNGMLAFVDALVGALLPAGTVAVERGRLERLIAYVAADLACTGWPDEDGANPHWERYLAARAALRPGDTDAVPDPAGAHDGRE